MSSFASHSASQSANVYFPPAIPQSANVFIDTPHGRMFGVQVDSPSGPMTIMFGTLGLPLHHPKHYAHHYGGPYGASQRRHHPFEAVYEVSERSEQYDEAAEEDRAQEEEEGEAVDEFFAPNEDDQFYAPHQPSALQGYPFRAVTGPDNTAVGSFATSGPATQPSIATPANDEFPALNKAEKKMIGTSATDKRPGDEVIGPQPLIASPTKDEFPALNKAEKTEGNKENKAAPSDSKVVVKNVSPQPEQVPKPDTKVSKEKQDWSAVVHKVSGSAATATPPLPLGSKPSKNVFATGPVITAFKAPGPGRSDTTKPTTKAKDEDDADWTGLCKSCDCKCRTNQRYCLDCFRNLPQCKYYSECGLRTDHSSGLCTPCLAQAQPESSVPLDLETCVKCHQQPSVQQSGLCCVCLAKTKPVKRGYCANWWKVYNEDGVPCDREICGQRTHGRGFRYCQDCFKSFANEDGGEDEQQQQD